MSTASKLPAQVATPVDSNLSTSTEAALVPLPVAEEPGALQLTTPLTRLPVELDVSVPVRGFRVRHLLALVKEQVVETRWDAGEDLPLAAGEVQLAWSEFEVVESTMAIRITRLA